MHSSPNLHGLKESTRETTVEVSSYSRFSLGNCLWQVLDLLPLIAIIVAVSAAIWLTQTGVLFMPEETSGEIRQPFLFHPRLPFLPFVQPGR
jgi:hypothetical protein